MMNHIDSQAMNKLRTPNRALLNGIRNPFRMQFASQHHLYSTIQTNVSNSLFNFCDFIFFHYES